MKALTQYPVTGVDALARPESFKDFTLDSPALDFFTDFESTAPFTIRVSTPAINVEGLMISAHVRLMLVVNDKDEFVGVISADGVTESAIVQKVSEGTKRAEITVGDMMVGKPNLAALEYQELEYAKISDVINALKNHGRRHYLVVDNETRKIRGIFSASDISRKLKLPLTIQEGSDFYKVFAAVSNG